jgi:hypothetical protein
MPDIDQVVASLQPKRTRASNGHLVDDGPSATSAVPSFLVQMLARSPTFRYTAHAHPLHHNIGLWRTRPANAIALAAEMWRCADAGSRWRPAAPRC